jgi:SAM-dependent methyltransferase
VPVLAGIPVLVDDPFARRAATAGKDALVVALAHFMPPSGLAGRIARRLGRLPIDRARRLAADAALPFPEAAAALGRGREAEYFATRATQDPFRAGRALLEAAPPGPALDVGCGAGHLEAACRGRTVVGLDRNFPLLYLARRFVHPDGLFVCADACRPLPFADGAFAATFSMDVFQYLPRREEAAREMDRLTRRDGRVILTHLRDRKGEAPHEMPSLAPEAYGRFFASRTPRFYAEDAWLGSAIPEPVPPGTLDATRPYVLVAALERPGPM